MPISRRGTRAGPRRRIRPGNYRRESRNTSRRTSAGANYSAGNGPFAGDTRVRPPDFSAAISPEIRQPITTLLRLRPRRDSRITIAEAAAIDLAEATAEFGRRVGGERARSARGGSDKKPARIAYGSAGPVPPRACFFGGSMSGGEEHATRRILPGPDEAFALARFPARPFFAPRVVFLDLFISVPRASAAVHRFGPVAGMPGR